ncbi:LysM peptidoglycan-binding domain-containing protein [Leuconostoc citreum]
MKSSTIIKSAVAAGAFVAAGVATASANSVTVKSGDTLNQIARANGTTVDALVKANGINNPNLIFVGQQLQTEGTASAAQAKPAQAPATATNGAYTVKAGDTLYRIAAANGTSVATLVAANNIQNLNFISVGQVLNLSGNAVAAAPAKQVAAQPAVTPAQPATPAAKQVTQPEVAPATVAPTQTVAPAQQTTTVTTQAAETTTATTQVTPVAQTTTHAVQPAQTATPNSAIQTLLNTLNAKRSALGLGPVSLDAGLSARAAARAANAVANGGLPVNHFRTNGEVVAIGWGYGDVVNAWYNETNMVTNGTPGHRMWVANPRATSVGFGIVGDTIVAESDAGQY